MSYVNLPFHIPHEQQAALYGLGQEELSYEEQLARHQECTATNKQVEADFSAAMKAWKKAKRAYEKYITEAKRAGAKNAGIDSAYASKMATYNAKMRQYEAAYAAWKNKADQNQNCIRAKRESDAAQKREAEALAKEYGATLNKTGTWWCISASTKKKAEEECAWMSQTVRGVGALNTTGQHACFLKNYPTCKYWSCPSHPGRAPTKPTHPGSKPPHVARPTPVDKPGRKPSEPTLQDCGPKPVEPSMGIGTAGLIAILVLGGGALGYRYYKKRKKK
jgi:hypothetical protein